MAKQDTQFLSINAYAKLIGVNEKAVRNAVRDGKIVKGYDPDRKKIIKKFADKEYGHLHLVPKARPGVSKEKRAEKIEAEKSEKVVPNSDVKPVKKEVVKKIAKSPNKSEKMDPESSDESDDFKGDFTYEELLLKIPVTPDLSYTEATKRREIIQLALDKKKLEELQDVLVRKQLVEKALFAFGNQLKKALLAIPARIMADVKNAPTDVEAINIMTEEINETLANYSRFEDIRLTNK